MKGFKITITEIEGNPCMDDFEGYHYRLTFTNKDTKVRRSFNYSVGYGHIDRKRSKLINGLLGCLYLDSIYTDKEEFYGLGYDEDSKKADRTYNAICANDKKIDDLGISRAYLARFRDN